METQSGKPILSPPRFRPRDGVMNIGDPLRDCETQAGPFHLASGRVCAIEAPEDKRQVGFRNSDAVVLDRDRHVLPPGNQPDLYCAGSPRILRSVIQQDPQ